MENIVKTKVIIAGVDLKGFNLDSRMAELNGLAIANKLEVVGEITQKLDYRYGGTYFGQGKLVEIKNELELKSAELLIVSDELSPTQIRNLERILNVTVIDRTELILEIFEKRARSKEAKIQVEIAKLQYELPRIHFSNQKLDQQGGGGFHNRGAGETKSEINRRTIGKQISNLRERLKRIELIHATQSQERTKSGIPLIALVGYTNAGKSTTFNKLPSALEANEKSAGEAFAADMLFATLDTTIKSIQLLDQTQFLLSDTVGFIDDLPHQLIESFKTTLQEAKDADLLINVADYSDPNCDAMIATTKKILGEIEADEVPMITFYNKADLIPGCPYPITKDQEIFGSALDSTTLQELGRLIVKQVFEQYQTVKLMIPFSKGEVASQIMKDFQVISCQYQAEGTEIIAKLSPSAKGRFKKYMTI